MADRPNNPLDDELLRDLGLEPRAPQSPKPQETAGSQAARATTASQAPRPQATTQARPTPQTLPNQPSPPSRPQRPVITPPGPPSPEEFSQGMGRLAEEMPIQLVAVLGKKNMSLKDIIALKQGEVVDLKKLPEESVDLVANGKLVARGELVLIDGRLGVQIKQLAS